MDTSTPVLPVTIPVNGGYGSGYSHKGGLDGTDASFLSALHLNHNIDRNIEAIHDNGRDALIATLTAKFDNAVQTMEAKFETERAVKEAQLASERLARETFTQMSAFHQDVAKLIAFEGDKTRAEIRDREKRDKDNDILLLKLGALIKAPTPTP